MKYARTLTAPLSAILLIVIAALAFMNLRTGTEYPPPLLDPKFDLWISDPAFGGQRLVVWELEYERGDGDQITLRKALVGGKTALEMQIYQDGTDDEWTYVRLAQKIDGSRLRSLLDEEIGIWIYMEPSCASRVFPSTGCLFEVETNDGMHTLEFVFGETAAQMNRSPAHRTIFLQASQMEWSHHLIDLVTQYQDARWELPDRISLSMTFWALGSETGRYLAAVHGFTVAQKTSTNSAEQLEPPDILSEDSRTSCVVSQYFVYFPDTHLLMQMKSAEEDTDFTRV